MFLSCRLLSARHLAINLALLFLCLVGVASAGAQSSRIGAAFQGTVTDSTGAVIPNAKITLRNTLTNQTRTAESNERGFFRAEQLAVGTYEVRAAQPGFAPYQHAPLQLSL